MIHSMLSAVIDGNVFRGFFWQFLMIGVLTWRTRVAVRRYANRPSRLCIMGFSPLFGTWLTNFHYIWAAPDIIAACYAKACGEPFAISSLAEYQVLVSSQEHVKELGDSVEEQLSFHAAMEDRLSHKYTMYGFQHNDVDPHNTVPIRSLKVCLRSNLPALRPKIQQRIEEEFSKELAKAPFEDGWTSIPTFRFAKRVTGQINNQILVGDKLTNDPTYCSAAIRYVEDVVVTMESCRQIPSLFIPLVSTIIMGWSGAMSRVAKCITPLVRDRLHGCNDSKDSEKPLDCIQWVLDSSHNPNQRTVTRMVQQMVALLFASAHQLPMALVYAIYNLCTHPEYIEPLRSEAREASRVNENDKFSNMPLLESFLRESARMNPLDALSVQRKAVLPFTFSDGTHVPAGNLVGVPQHAMMRDEAFYPNAAAFDGFRYVRSKADTLSPTIKYTDVTWTFPFWGAPKKACPARWYVSYTMKMILAHLLLNYDIKLANEKASRIFTWTTAIVPRFSTRIMIRKRES